jgi:hypothetical protein
MMVNAVVPRFIQFSARTSGVNKCTVGGRIQPATNDPGRLRAHLSCKRAALSAHKRDLSLPRRGGERGLGCGGVGQPNTLPPRPAAGSKALLLGSIQELDRWTGGGESEAKPPLRQVFLLLELGQQD